MVPEGLAADYSFPGVFGIVMSPVEIGVVVYGIFYTAVCRVLFWMWIMASRKLIFV